MAPADTLTPAGSATYQSDTLYVGDGTWDSTKNDFLLPNLQGLNFDTMRYNGMGNRFSTMTGYYALILGHGVIAAITFLFIVPAAIMIARFYGRNPRWALRLHIYLQIMTVGLTTVIFILGWMAVGPARSLTNPHHGIGLAIYVLVLAQAIGGWWIHKREKGKIIRKIPVKLVLHQWFGRSIALLGIAQVPMGLTLYGSPKYLFILYALWMFFLLVWYFVLSYRATAAIGGLIREESHHGETVITERTGRSRSRVGGILGPLAAGAGLAALLGRKRSRSRSQGRNRVDEIPSRRGSRRDSGSYIEEEKFRQRKESGGVMDKLFKGAAVLGAGALAKTWFDRRRNKDDEEYSSVAQGTPGGRNRLQRRPSVSDLTESSILTHRMEDRRTGGPILPGPGEPLMAATAISAADRPVTPRPLQGRSRQNSFDSESYSSTMSPSRRPESSHGIRNGLLAGLGLGWFSKKMKDRRETREMRKLEEERRARYGSTGSRYTGDGFPSGRRQRRRGSMAESSDLSTVLTNPHPPLAPSSIPTVPVPLGAHTGSTIGQSRSRHDVTEHVSMPVGPPDSQGLLHHDSDSEAYVSAGGTHRHHSHSSRRRKESEAAAAAAAASGLAAAEEERRQRERSRSRSAMASPPVSVKVKVHGDKDRNVTLRRLTEEEALAERASRKGQRRRRGDSMSSLSGTDAESSSRRYRRDASRRRADSVVSAKQEEALSSTGPPVTAPLSPPDPPYAGGRRPKDSAYYSGKPAMSRTSITSPASHGTWSEMSPSGIGSGQEDAAERRRRRRLERNQRQTGTVDFT